MEMEKVETILYGRVEYLIRQAGDGLLKSVSRLSLSDRLKKEKSMLGKSILKSPTHLC